MATGYDKLQKPKGVEIGISAHSKNFGLSMNNAPSENNTSEAPIKFAGEIKVASRIVDYLSSGLYKSPAACLKELINNAYDADARTVHVFVKPDADRIIIQDDGNGMTKDEFVHHFERISESHKRDVGERTIQFGRPKVGKIGIGFIAANEICETLEIFSTKAGSTELLHVTVNFSEMSRPLSERRRGESDIAKADYEGEVLRAELDEHFTHIFLEHVRGEARNILVGATSQSLNTTVRSLYGKNPTSVVNALKEPTLNSWKDFDFYTETMLRVALNVPVRYANGWIPIDQHEKVSDIEREVDKLKFDVFYDGTELRKPIVFSPGSKKHFVEPFSFKGKHVSAHGYFYAQHGVLKPQDLHGLLIRIRNAAVGEYDSTFWGFTPSIMQLIQRWVSVEIWADDRLEDAMNIDRSTLREAHPAYVELRSEIHSQLRRVLERARKRLYEAGSEVRRKQSAADARQSISATIYSVAGEISKPTARKLAEAWSKSVGHDVSKQSLKRYTVAELYGVVVEVAKDVLDAEQLELFLTKLTNRLIK